METVKQTKIITIYEASSFYQISFIHLSFKRTVKLIWSNDNLVDLLTKLLPIAILKKIVHNIDMRQFTDIFIINNWRSMYSWGRVKVLKDMCWLNSFSFAKVFFHRGFLCKVLIRHILSKWLSKRKCCKYTGFGFRAKPTFFGQQSQLNNRNLLTAFNYGLLDCSVEMYFSLQLQQYHIIPPIISLLLSYRLWRFINNNFQFHCCIHKSC